MSSTRQKWPSFVTFHPTKPKPSVAVLGITPRPSSELSYIKSELGMDAALVVGNSSKGNYIVKNNIYHLVVMAGTLAFGLSQAEASAQSAPDNTVVNQRDHSPDAKTADHQIHGTKSDVEVTRLIRRQITKDDTFSTNAKNVKIVATADSVTLRGPVNSTAEKNKVGSVAESVATGRTIQNELEVKQ